MRVGNIHSALGRDSPMPGQLDKRMAFKGTLLVKSLELTHAFASSQGNLMSLVGGDYNMTFTEVDQALRRDLKLEIQWEISDNDPNGNRDFMFATCGDITKLDMTVLNFEGVHSLVAAAMPLPHTVPPVPRAGTPGALASSQGPGALASSQGPQDGGASKRRENRQVGAISKSVAQHMPLQLKLCLTSPAGNLSRQWHGHTRACALRTRWLRLSVSSRSSSSCKLGCSGNRPTGRYHMW